MRARHRHPEDRVQRIEQSLMKCSFTHARKPEGMLDARVGGAGKPRWGLIGEGSELVDRAAHAIAQHHLEALNPRASASGVRVKAP